MRLIVIFDTPPTGISASSELLDWLRPNIPAYITYRNPEGNLEDGSIVSFDGDLYVGTKPARAFQEDFDDWRVYGAAELTPKGWTLLLGKKIEDRSLLKRLNLTSQLGADEHRRL
ncbi:MAG: hypothetical protein WC787_01395 [Patescibacteria group bacterium]|jgi:hypothetical protein